MLIFFHIFLIDGGRSCDRSLQRRHGLRPHPLHARQLVQQAGQQTQGRTADQQPGCVGRHQPQHRKDEPGRRQVVVVVDANWSNQFDKFRLQQPVDVPDGNDRRHDAGADDDAGRQRRSERRRQQRRSTRQQLDDEH